VNPTTHAAAPDQPQIIDGELWLPHSILPAAQAGPPGLAQETVALQKPGAEGRSASNVRRFFSVVLLANGLHMIYLCFGLLLGLWLLVSNTRRGAPKTALATVAAYWVVIAGIGLVLVPAFYL
jgi:hypothetical protein